MAGILSFSDAVSLALHGMAVLAFKGEKMLAVHQIALELDVSEAHLAKVMQRLAKAGLLRAVRGPNGGFALERDPHEVRLIDIYQAMEGQMSQHGCMFSHPLCDGKQCIFGTALNKVQESVSSYLSETTLATAAELYGRKVNAAQKDR